MSSMLGLEILALWTCISPSDVGTLLAVYDWQLRQCTGVKLEKKKVPETQVHTHHFCCLRSTSFDN